MKLNKIIEKINGSMFPATINEEAFKLYAEMEPLWSEITKETMESGYEFNRSFKLKEYLSESADRWRRLIWCYQKTMYNKIKREDLTPDAIGMGVALHKEKSKLPGYYPKEGSTILKVMERARKLSMYESRLKEDGKIDEHIFFTRAFDPDIDNWKGNMAVMTQEIFREWNAIDLRPESMYEHEGRFVSYFYIVKYGAVRFVFHTAVAGFDTFCIIRHELGNKMPESAKHKLGEYGSLFGF